MKAVPPLLRRSWWTWERRVLLVLAALLVVVVLANDWAVLTPDTKPESSSRRGARRPASQCRGSTHRRSVPRASTSAWRRWPQPSGCSVRNCRPGWPCASRRILLLLVAAWGARRLYRDLVAGSSADRAAGRVAVAVAYVANPYVVSGGGTTPTMLPYALLPWFLLLTRRAVRDRSWATACMAALSMAATSGLNAGVVGLPAAGRPPPTPHLRRRGRPRGVPAGARRGGAGRCGVRGAVPLLAGADCRRCGHRIHRRRVYREHRGDQRRELLRRGRAGSGAVDALRRVGADPVHAGSPRATSRRRSWSC